MYLGWAQPAGWNPEYLRKLCFSHAGFSRCFPIINTSYYHRLQNCCPEFSSKNFRNPQFAAHSNRKTNTMYIFDFSLGLIGDLIEKLQIDTRLRPWLWPAKNLRFFSENTRHAQYDVYMQTQNHKFSTKIPDFNFAFEGTFVPSYLRMMITRLPVSVSAAWTDQAQYTIGNVLVAEVQTTNQCHHPTTPNTDTARNHAWVEHSSGIKIHRYRRRLQAAMPETRGKYPPKSHSSNRNARNTSPSQRIKSWLCGLQ